MNVKLTTTRGEEVLINWDSVDFALNTDNYFGENYTEVRFGKQRVDVKESLEEVEIML